MAAKGKIENSLLKDLASDALFNQVNDPVIVFDRAGVIRFINKAVTRVAGYSQKDLVGKNFKTMRTIVPESIPIAKKYFIQAMRGKKVPPHELKIFKKNKGIIIGATTISALKHHGKSIGAVILFHDHTQHKELEEDLRESSEKYKRLFSMMLNGFAYHKIITNRAGKPVDYIFLEINDAFEKLTGLKRNKIIGKRITKVIPEIEKDTVDWVKIYGEVALKGKEKRFENYSAPLDRWYSVYAYSPRKGYFATIFENITARKNAEEKAREAAAKLAKRQEKKISQKKLQRAAFALARTEAELEKQKEIDKMKTDFVSIASHQLRTPLTSISWYLESLLDGMHGRLSKAQKKYMELAMFGSKRLTRLLNDLLNVSRLETGRIGIRPRKQDLTHLLKDQIEDVRIMAEEKNCKIKFLKPKRTVNLRIDRSLLRQVVSNLLTNAIRFSPRNRCDITLKLSRQKKGLVVSVSDKGIGIPKKEQEKLFEKFYRTSTAMKMVPGGTGLGLYIAKLIVEAWGGKIWYKTARGKGTTFYFTIPLQGMKSKRGEIGLA